MFINDKLVKNSKPIKITVDGKEIKGDVVAPFDSGKHRVEVRLG